MKTLDLNYETRLLVKSLIAVCADSPARVRPCDAGRLYDMAKDAGVILYVRQVLERDNPPAYEAFEEYESELMR